MADYSDNDPKGWCGVPGRGAAMGRVSLRGALSGALTVRLVHLYDGYDRNGTYFGDGDPLYWVSSEDGEVDFVLREASREGKTLEERIHEDYPGASIVRDPVPVGYSDEELLQYAEENDECPVCYFGRVVFTYQIECTSCEVTAEPPKWHQMHRVQRG